MAESLCRISVVIPNYNYERFVATAIESALALDWPDVEVVVVDDGSTDASLEVIRRYEDRVTIVATENATQRVAVNRGVARTTGDVVIVLDSDDRLPPELPHHLARVWGPGVSKVQFSMRPVDEHGSSMGKVFPRAADDASSADLRNWFLRTTAYPTPPGSANAYARWFVDLVLPVDDERLGSAADSALLAAAPVLGDVVVVPEVVVDYRRHSDNDSNLLADTTRFAREINRAEARWSFVRELPGHDRLQRRALFRSRELLQLRVAAHACEPGYPPALAGDGYARMVWDTMRSPAQPGPESARARLVVTGWCLATLLAPPRLARRLVHLRYAHKG